MLRTFNTYIHVFRGWRGGRRYCLAVISSEETRIGEKSLGAAVKIPIKTVVHMEWLCFYSNVFSCTRQHHSGARPLRRAYYLLLESLAIVRGFVVFGIPISREPTF